MSLTALMTAALLGQSAFSLGMETPAADRMHDVAYQELSQGRSEAALRKLESSSAVEAGDPAALINLGSAYASAGRHAGSLQPRTGGRVLGRFAPRGPHRAQESAHLDGARFALMPFEGADPFRQS